MFNDRDIEYSDKYFDMICEYENKIELVNFKGVEYEKRQY